MWIGTLKRAAYYDIRLFQCNTAEVLVEIKIIAGEECKPDAVDCHNWDRLVLIGIAAVEISSLLRGKVLLVILPSQVA